MRVTIRLFARLKELTGASELERSPGPGSTVRDVWNALAAEFPDLRGYGRAVSAAVNAEYTSMEAEVREGDEIAFLPPVSGGTFVRSGGQARPSDRGDGSGRRNSTRCSTN